MCHVSTAVCLSGHIRGVASAIASNPDQAVEIEPLVTSNGVGCVCAYTNSAPLAARPMIAAARRNRKLAPRGSDRVGAERGLQPHGICQDGQVRTSQATVGCLWTNGSMESQAMGAQASVKSGPTRAAHACERVDPSPQTASNRKLRVD